MNSQFHSYSHAHVHFSITGKKFNPDTVFTMAALTQLESRAGIPVLTELESRNHEFQTVLRVKQHNVSGAITKWLTAPVLSRITPTWKNLLLVLHMISLDNLAQQFESYLVKHPLSDLEEDAGEETNVAMSLYNFNR